MAEGEKQQEHKQKQKQKRRRQPKAVVASAKRKRALVRITLAKGGGRVFFNKKPLSLVSNALAREIVLEPFYFVDNAGDYDVEINARGGGVMGQAQAARTALAKALVEITGSAELKQRMLAFDRSLLIDDPRLVEPKKFKGPKARARFTKSYR